MLWTLLLLVASSDAVTAAQPADSPDVLAKVAPYVDDLTRIVIVADLSRVDVPLLLRMVLPSLPEGLAYEADLQRLREVLLAAGVKDVCLLVSLADLPQQPWFLLSPCPPDWKPAELEQRLPSRWPVWSGRAGAQTVQRIDRDDAGPMLFIGQAATAERLTRASSSSRPELTAAWHAAGEAALRILFLPTGDDRRVVEELWPTLPERFGGGPTSILTRGVCWAAGAIDVTPSRSLRLTVESADPQAALALQGRWTKLLAGLLLPSRPATAAGQGPAGQIAVQLERLLPNVDDRRLVLTRDQKGEGLAALEDVLALWPVAGAVIGYYIKDQLKQLALAMHNWHDTNERLPAQANYDQNGQALLSWRVHLLPFLGEEAAALYRRFRLDEPWDSEHNRPLVREMPPVYTLPGSRAAAEGRTCYLRPIGESTSCPGPRSIALRDITDGTSSTAMIVEVDDEHAVVWTKPDDWTFDAAHPGQGLGGHVPGSAWSVFCDGAPHDLKHVLVDAKQLPAAFTRSGGEWLQIRRRIQGLSF